MRMTTVASFKLKSKQSLTMTQQKLMRRSYAIRRQDLDSLQENALQTNLQILDGKIIKETKEIKERLTEKDQQRVTDTLTVVEPEEMTEEEGGIRRKHLE